MKRTVNVDDLCDAIFFTQKPEHKHRVAIHELDAFTYGNSLKISFFEIRISDSENRTIHFGFTGDICV